MNEIEKLYELAEVQPQYKKRIECKEGHRVGQPCGKCPCINCDKSIFEDVMPQFTAEKQLKLVELLLMSKWWLNLVLIKSRVNFSDGLAEVINHLWQDLTEEEKEQIRSVLNGN